MAQQHAVDGLDDETRARLANGQVASAAGLVVRRLGPEVFGFLRATLLSESDADDVFAISSENLWRSLATFEWRCSVRTWFYTIARNEALRFLEGSRRRGLRHATESELDDLVAAVRTETRSELRTERVNKLNSLREELTPDDRTLLVLRVDRDMPWQDVARAFFQIGADPSDEDMQREAARLRKRFQIVRERLMRRAREEGLLPTID